MKLSEIQELIKFVARAGVNEVEIEQKEFKILIKSDYLAKKKSNIKEEPQIIQQQVPVAMPQAVQAAPAQVAAAPAVSATVEVKEPAAAAPAKDEEANYITVKSQMIGTFYRSPSPDKPAFVSVGDSIKEGDPICIIEAMKLFNEIESEVSGKIVKVLVDDATPVEFDQPLFLVDPS
ncbi:MAG: acetyl-CoA carboxylase biotin carboxyl carrier protein [Flavobacteriales bacterium]|jgi:acetyl-CoA carboxylase biotin carboxyl carrier protein|nr:acetyl-CoA carboxylase biotin carboxyl carrier protein [Flavobacteriales bacterium]